jgi:hypothetical protein
MAVIAPEVTDTLTINGDTSGYASIASNTNYYPGCKAYISCGAKAELDLGTLGSGALDSVIGSLGSGGEGNLISIEVIGDSVLGGGVEIEIDSENAITVHYESLVSTVADIETAIGVFGIIEVTTPGTAITVLDVAADDIPKTYLAGGIYSHECVITDLGGGATKVGLRFIDGTSKAPSYGRSDLSDYKVADGAIIHQPMQPAPTDASFKKLPLY